jgi:hypothetical protein
LEAVFPQPHSETVDMGKYLYQSECLNTSGLCVNYNLKIITIMGSGDCNLHISLKCKNEREFRIYMERANIHCQGIA